MLAHECQISVVRCQVSLYANLGCYMSYCYLSVNMTSALSQELYIECFVLYAKFAYMPVAVCLQLYAGTWVPSSSLWVVKLAYMSNYYISVYMPSALFQELYAEWYGLYAKLHMLDCDMPNAMTIAMSFRMTTEQVGYFIIYIYVYYPAMTLHIAVTEKKLLLYHQSFSLYLKVSGISVCRHIMAKSKVLVCRHMLYFVSWPAYLKSQVSVC
jgi:hypothetical protein